MMSLQTPQRQSPNPKPYQNLQDFRSENKQESHEQMRAANIEKFKEIVIKLANSVPNKPLSEAKNSLIRDRFDRFLSVLHTPDHPPYAWMIERALRELNENGGSSEASISNFIRKEYDDLPWSHPTLLKHHLQALCECGDIVLIHGQRYLLAAAVSTLDPSKNCRRKSTRKKRDWDWKIKRRKRRKKDIGKESLLQKEDQVHERQNCMMEGLGQQKLEAKGRKDMPQLYVVGEDGEQIEGDQSEITTPERPPGFDSATFEGPCHLPVCGTESPFQGKHPTRGPTEVVVSAAEGLPGHQEQNHVFNVSDQLNHEEQQVILSAHGTPERIVNQTLQDVQPITTSGIDSLQTKNEEDPAMPSQTRPTELYSQKKLPESELPKNTAAISETEPLNLTGGRQVTRIVFKYQKRPPVIKTAKENDLSCTIQEIKEELLQQNQIKCSDKKHLDDNLLASHGLPNTNKQQEVKSGAANRSEHQGIPIPAVKPSCEEQHHSREIIEIPDISPRGSSLLQREPQEHEISDTNEVQELKLRTGYRSVHQGLPSPTAKLSCEEQHQSEAFIRLPKGPAVSSKLSICSKQPNGVDGYEFSGLPRPSELQAMDIEESLPTPRMQRQTKRWAKQPSNLKRPQPEHQAPMELSQVTRKEVKLYSREKRNAGQLEVALAPSVASKQADSQKLSKLASLEMHPEVEPQTQVLKHHPEKQISQEKPSCRVLRPRPLKPEQSGALTTTDLLPPHNQQDMQQQPKYSCRGRPPKAKPDIRVTNDKVVSYPNPHPRQQSQKPKNKRRGRPPKYKLGASTIIDEKLLSGTRQHRPRNHDWGRPQKAVEQE